MKTSTQQIKWIILFLAPILFSTNELFAIPTNFTWNGSESRDWRESKNWDPEGIPGTNDTVLVVSGSNTIELSGDVTVKMFTIESETIDLYAYTLTITGPADFKGGEINNGHLIISGTSTIKFYGTTFGAVVNATGGTIFLDGSVFNDSLLITKNGKSNDNSKGGNTFAEYVSITNSDEGALVLADSFPDTFDRTVDFTNLDQKGAIYIAHRSSGNIFNGDVKFAGQKIYSNYYGTAEYNGNISIACQNGEVYFGLTDGSCTLADEKIIALSDVEFSSGKLFFRNFTKLGTGAIDLTLVGSAKVYFDASIFNSEVTISAPSIYLSTSRFLAGTTFTKTGSGTEPSLGGCYFGGTTSITNNHSSSVFTLNSAYTDTFAAGTTIQNTLGTLQINNAVFSNAVLLKNSVSSTALDRFFVAATGSCVFNGALTVENTGSGFNFGNVNGTTTVSSTGSLTFTSGLTGNVNISNFTKLNSGNLSLSFPSTTTKLILGPNSILNGDFNFYGQSICLNGTTFNNTTSITRYGNIPDTCKGGNVFNGTTTIKDSIAGTYNLLMAYNTADDYNGNVTFIQKGSGGKIYPAYTKNITFSGNITVDASSSFQFGGIGGKVILDGSANQSLTSLTSQTITMKKLQLNKSSNSFTLACPLSIADSLQLSLGRINTDTTNLLTIAHGGKLTGGSDSTYINGPIKKTGNSAFVFPIGSSTLAHPYHPLEITAPSSSTDAYTANYFPTSQTIGTAIDTSIDNLNACQYWKLNRNAGTSKVKVKLAWNYDSCETVSPTNFRVTGWNDSLWEDLGNSATSGDSIQGTVQSNDSVNTITNFTLAFLKCSAFRKIVTHKNVRCHGGADGAAIISLKGGTIGYRYEWRDSVSLGGDKEINNLKVGNYYISALDKNGCFLSDSIIISEPDSITLELSTTQSSCGDSSGSITALPVGGTGSFQFFWMYDASTTNTLSSVPSGEYFVLITDSNGCAKTAGKYLDDSDGPGMNIVSQTNLVCSGADSGIVEVEGADSNDPFFYSWSTSVFDTLPILNNLRSGVYVVKIINDLGCVSFDSIEITEPEYLKIEFETTSTPCGFSTGSITAAVTGGSRPYSYTWSRSSDTDSVIISLPSGIDTLSIVDQNGCLIRSQTEISNSTGLTLSPIVISDVNCFPTDLGSATVTVTGGTQPYSYLWSPNGGAGDTAINLPSDNYSVTVVDANGCRKTANFFIDSPDELMVFQQIIGPSTDSTDDGKARAIVSGGTLPYIYSWSSGSTVDSIYNVGVGNDTLVVIDAHGCTVTSIFRIINRPINTCWSCASTTSCGPFSHPSCPPPCLNVLKNIKLDFGAQGDGITNDQCAFEEAASYFSSLPFNSNKLLEIPPGTYIVGRQEQRIPYGLDGNTVLCFENINNMQIIGKVVGTQVVKLKFMDCMQYGAFDFPTLPDTRYLTCNNQSNPCSLNSNTLNKIATPGNMIHFTGCNNIVIKNIELDGNMDNTIIGGGYTETIQIPTRGIFLNACRNITIDKVNVHDFGYDGITIYFMDCPSSIEYPPQYPPIMNCNISNSFFTMNGRNNMTWGGGIGMNVYKTEFNYAGQGRLTSQPASGIDIEYEQSNVPTAQGQFTKCKFKYNKYYGVNSNSAQNLTTNVQYDYKFDNCLIVGSQNGLAAWPNARGFKFKHCQFVGRLEWAYASLLARNAINRDNTEFTDCSFNEEYLDPEILPYERKSFAPTANETMTCHGDEHEMMLKFGWTIRTYFTRCTWSTNYTLKLMNLSQDLYLTGATIASYNLNRIIDCEFKNHGLNACVICDWELAYLNYINFFNRWATIEVIGGGMRNEPTTGCAPRYYQGTLNNNSINVLFNPSGRFASIEPIVTKYTDPTHPYRETSFFNCIPCPYLISPTYPSCEAAERKSSPKILSDENNEIYVTPNPTTNFVYLSNAKNSNYRVVDLYSKEVKVGICSSDNFQIDLSNLNPGVYIIILADQRTKRIIKM